MSNSIRSFFFFPCSLTRHCYPIAPLLIMKHNYHIHLHHPGSQQVPTEAWTEGWGETHGELLSSLRTQKEDHCLHVTSPQRRWGGVFRWSMAAGFANEWYKLGCFGVHRNVQMVILYLVGGFKHVLFSVQTPFKHVIFSVIYGIILPIGFHIFSRWLLHHQPEMIHRWSWTASRRWIPSP